MAFVVAGVADPFPRALLAAFHVESHRLQRNLSRPGEAIPAKLPRAGKQSRRKLLKHRLHLDGAFFVNPAARLDVNLLTRRESDFKHVAKAMQPEDAFPRRTRKRINKKSRSAQQHVRHAFDAREGV